METLDGRRGTAREVLKWLTLKDNTKNHEAIMLKRTFMKYTLIRLRQKISFIAFKKKMTILQLFLNAIIKSYQGLSEMGMIASYKE